MDYFTTWKRCIDEGAERVSLENLRRVETIGRIGTIGTDGINGINGINGKFPSSEAIHIKRSVTHQAKRYPSILSRGRKGIEGY